MYTVIFYFSLPLIILGAVIAILYNIYYKKTEYYIITHIPYIQMRLDLGRFGEYLTYQELKSLPGYKRFLFNCYLPKNEESTTEVDVIMLHESGIYVFESKNYSGWIFGAENQKEWTQSLPAGRNRTQTSRFMNPIMQNKVHIKWLQTYLEKYPKSSFYSYIVFSERCTLKKVPAKGNNYFVINRYDLFQTVSSQISKTGLLFTHKQIDTLFDRLYPLTQVGDKVKNDHIQDIQNKYKK